MTAIWNYFQNQLLELWVYYNNTLKVDIWLKFELNNQQLQKPTSKQSYTDDYKYINIIQQLNAVKNLL